MISIDWLPERAFGLLNSFQCYGLFGLICLAALFATQLQYARSKTLDPNLMIGPLCRNEDTRGGKARFPGRPRGCGRERWRCCALSFIAGLLQLSLMGANRGVFSALDHPVSNLVAGTADAPCPHVKNASDTPPDSSGRSPSDGNCSCPFCQFLRLTGLLPGNAIPFPHPVPLRKLVESGAWLFAPAARPRAPPPPVSNYQ